MSRRAGLIGLVGLFGIFAVIGVIMFIGSSAGCMNTASNASCPVLADVGSTRYLVGGGQDLVGAEAAMTPHAQITRTNSPVQFMDETAYALAGVDPTQILVTRTVAPMHGESPVEDDGPYRLLRLYPRTSDAAWLTVCPYLPPAQRADDELCR